MANIHKCNGNSGFSLLERWSLSNWIVLSRAFFFHWNNSRITGDWFMKCYCMSKWCTAGSTSVALDSCYWLNVSVKIECLHCVRWASTINKDHMIMHFFLPNYCFLTFFIKRLWCDSGFIKFLNESKLVKNFKHTSIHLLGFC